MNNKQIVAFLSKTTVDDGLVQKMKVKYRPWICPFDELLAYADGKTSALDIGCGAGQFCALLAEFTDLKKIHGIEINDRLIKDAKAINNRVASKKSVTFEKYDGQHLPTAISKYDLIYMIDVYHHIPKQYQADYIAQIYDRMKPGALFVLKDIDASSPWVVGNKLHDLVFSGELGNEMSYSDAKERCQDVGFEIVESRKKRIAIYPHYFVIAKKPLK